MCFHFCWAGCSVGVGVCLIYKKVVRPLLQVCVYVYTHRLLYIYNMPAYIFVIKYNFIF